jgi:hypothetical protein
VDRTVLASVIDLHHSVAECCPAADVIDRIHPRLRSRQTASENDSTAEQAVAGSVNSPQVAGRDRLVIAEPDPSMLTCRQGA